MTPQKSPSPQAEHSTEPIEETSASMQAALSRIMRAVVSRRDPTSPLMALPVLQVRCLHIVEAQEELPMREIARLMEVDLPSLSRIADRLEQRGFLERRTDPNNRRVTWLRLTEKANEALEGNRRYRRETLRACLHNMDEGAAERIIEALHLLADAGEKAFPERIVPRPSSAPQHDPVVELLSRFPRTRRGQPKPAQTSVPDPNG